MQNKIQGEAMAGRYAKVYEQWRTDPDSFADDTRAVESTLNDGLFAEEYSISDFECFRMDYANVSPDGCP